MGLTEFLVEHFTRWIAGGGYWGLTVLMSLESMVAPVPSEAVMPFAGFLVYEHKFTFIGAILFSTLGSIIGSLISYYAGAWGGRPFVKRYGRYLLLNVHDLELTERFFSRYGDKTIFISRFIPVVRHLISIPAGVGRMKIGKFIVYTVIGAGLWNAFLTVVGYYLRNNWLTVRKYGEIADLIVIIIILAAIVFFVLQYRKRSRQNSMRTEGSETDPARDLS
jgi:membrane protein DedA with SNARE-associated domain